MVNGPVHVDKIARASKLSASKVSSINSFMEIEALGSGNYSLNR
ncbi:hypothetical protein IH981_03110 [Patescibacteria group bacterium]|nr:hypothetical protein [Patescibacteria group bacterium]